MQYSFKALSFTIVLFFFVILPYASLCHTFFHDNDPLRFGTFPLSVLSLFALSTFENWGAIYFINMGGCDSYNSEYLIAPSNMTTRVETIFGTFYTPVCSNPKAQPLLASVIFISFIFICGYFVVSMSLAAVAIGFQEKLELLKDSTVYGKDDNVPKSEPPSKGPCTPSSTNLTENNNRRKSVVGSKAAKLTGADKIQRKVKKLLQVIWEEISDEEFRSTSHKDFNLMHAKSIKSLSE